MTHATGDLMELRGVVVVGLQTSSSARCLRLIGLGGETELLREAFVFKNLRDLTHGGRIIEVCGR